MLKLDDFRRCVGVRGEVGIAGYFGPQLIVSLDSQPANCHVSWWSTNFRGIVSWGCCRLGNFSRLRFFWRTTSVALILRSNNVFLLSLCHFYNTAC